jgi:hypothetical protein
MSSTFYRREANRYRLLAADVDREQAEQFRRMAAECDDSADDLDKGASGDQTAASLDLSKRSFPAWPLLPGGSR